MKLPLPLFLFVIPEENGRPHHVATARHFQKIRLQADSNGRANGGDQFSKDTPQVLCIGDALLDCIANMDARGWTAEELMNDETKWTAFPGGAPANVATALCKLGTPSAFCGCVGTDEDGNLLQNLLQETGVDTRLLQRTEDYPSRRVIVTRSMKGDREFGGFSDNRHASAFSDAYLDSSALDEKELNTMLSNTQWIYSSTLSLAYPDSEQSVRKIVQQGLQSGAKLFVDVNWRPVFWPNIHPEAARQSIMKLVYLADIVKMTDEEAQFLVKISAKEALQNPLWVGSCFPKAKGVLITAGEKGASYCFQGGAISGRIPPFSVNVVETTGAGDAFTAGILHFLLADDTIDMDTASSFSPERVEALVRFATAVGALTCTKEGAMAAQPTFPQVKSFLNQMLQKEMGDDYAP